MIRIQIGRRRYKGPYLWSDITLEQYITLAGIPIPAKYRAYALANEKFDSNKKESIDQYLDTIAEIGEEELTVSFPSFYKSVIQILTDIPPGIIRNLSENQTTQIFDFYLRPFLLSLIFNTPVISLFGQLKDYEPPQISKIRIGLQVFILPKTIRINGTDNPLAQEPIITYAEACDLFKKSHGFTKDEIVNLPLLMAIYCRKKGEEYDEKRSLERVEIFKKATMDQVWSLFFYISRRLPGSGTFTQLFLTAIKPIKAIIKNLQNYQILETEH